MSSERSVREGSGTPATVLGQRVPDTRGTPAPIVCHRTPEDPGGAQGTILGRGGQESGTQGTILEDDQQLYDWGIENRLDQYTYQVTTNLYKSSYEPNFLSPIGTQFTENFNFSCNNAKKGAYIPSTTRPFMINVFLP